jgi:hypothetical protein
MYCTRFRTDNVTVLAVACVASGNATLSEQLRQRLVEGKQRMRGRGEAELAILIQPDDLVVNVQAGGAATRETRDTPRRCRRRNGARTSTCARYPCPC